MFNDFEDNGIIKWVYTNRFEDSYCMSEAVLAALAVRHDYGKNFFQKIFHRSSLRPDSVQTD